MATEPKFDKKEGIRAQKYSSLSFLQKLFNLKILLSTIIRFYI